MFFGFVGSLATIIILSSSKFNTTTFYYLKALSVSDLMYLLSAVGYLYEMFFLESSSQVPSITKVDLRCQFSVILMFDVIISSIISLTSTSCFATLSSVPAV